VNIIVDGRALEVFGPYRDDGGRIRAMTERQQRTWAKSVGGRLMTAYEFAEAWAQADAHPAVMPRDVVTAPLDALHDELIADVEAGRLVVAAKTWIEDGSGKPTNYGMLVPRAATFGRDGYRSWRGLRVYPTDVVGCYAVQPPGHAHGANHVDYSQLGYCVRDLDVVVDMSTGSSVPPSPRHLRRTTPPMVGDDVRDLQRALEITADGVFGPLTEAAVRRLQRGAGLVDDGVVGPMTRAAMAAPRDDEYTPMPSFEPLTTNSERAAIFGRFAFVPRPLPTMPEAIRITDNWPSRQLVQIMVPQLKLIPGVGGDGRGPAGGLVHCHHLVADQLRALWQAWEDAGLLDRVLTWGGLWCPRFVRGSRSMLSNHAWGTAFDINAAWNGLGREPARTGERGSVRELVPLAHDHGFYWGGHFSRRDGMHFEATEAACG